MNKLNNLISMIKRENKMTDAQIIEYLSNAIAHETEESEIYKNMYVEAFGYTISKEMAEELVHALPVTDGSDRINGERFTMQEAKEYASRVGANSSDIPSCEFYLVMNNHYSDYNRTMKKHNIDEPLIYADMALDWFNDPDADTNKTFYYFMMK